MFTIWSLLYQGRPLSAHLSEGFEEAEANRAFAMPFWSVRCMFAVGQVRVGGLAGVQTGDEP
jgi:hypothetical protein